jgi:hypothetical protein
MDMCWSESASVAMAGLGTVAAVVTARRGEPRAIPATLAFFAVMEALQAAGYLFIDNCSIASNKSVTVLSYLHIALQPIFINAFGMALVAGPVSRGLRRFVYGTSGLAFLVMLLSLVPFDWAGPCRPGQALCGPEWCTITGTWHLGWTMPLNDMWRAIYGARLADIMPFPAYVLAVFVLPLAYGAWRFVLFHAALGPILAQLLTDNPNEFPAVWCLFSVGLVLLAMSPLVRRSVAPRGALSLG